MAFSLFNSGVVPREFAAIFMFNVGCPTVSTLEAEVCCNSCHVSRGFLVNKHLSMTLIMARRGPSISVRIAKF